MLSDLFDYYTVFGDIGVIAICAVILILLRTSYIRRTRSLSIYIAILFCLVASAAVNIVYHVLASKGDPGLFVWVYVARLLYYTLLFNIFFLFTLYTTEITGLEHKKARVVAITSMTLYFLIIAIDIFRAVTGSGFRIHEDGTVSGQANIFVIGYLLYVVFLGILMYKVGNLLYRRVMYGFYGTMILAIVIRLAQLPLRQASLTTMTFVLPTIAMLYIMHSTPYNVTLGSVDVSALKDYIRTMHGRSEEFVFLSLLLPEFDAEGRDIPTKIRAAFRRFSIRYFHNCVMFRIGNGHVVLFAPKRQNQDYERRIRTMLEDFEKEYQQFQSPYKIVIGESVEQISKKNEYVSLIRNIEHDMRENTVRRLEQSDVDRFNRDEYILQQLTDIYNKRDMEDQRVLAYCQPVYNLESGQFDTAEALMRLELPNIGLVFPDVFIPMAENHGYIHILTEIILHKTCRAVRRMTEEGFHINRISVNVSVLELKDREFCADFNRIMGEIGVPGEKIAIELTESRSEADFLIMKAKIEELRDRGIRFYLDDFGTGYSNMERIMELPFDIIKFDRSMVIASGTGERSERIVENLAHMFRDMDYSVLYEGVEDEVDEERCREMSASYLQGYKYSRPIPIDQLRKFLPKVG